MKKFILVGALTLAAAGSWAFHPKATEPGGYMMVISSSFRNYSIIVISPTGEAVTQIIDSKPFTAGRSAAANLELYKAEIRKVNELKQAGWKVISASMRPNGYSGFGEYVYLLEK